MKGDCRQPQVQDEDASIGTIIAAIATSGAPMIGSMTDHELQHEVRGELKWDPSVDATRIAVSVNDGVVTLSGRVSTYPEKVAAEKAAKRVRGVRAVANEIEVVPDGAPPPDEEIAREALKALKWNIFVPSRKIKVSVSDGWVTLYGEVNWQFQKQAAEDAVSSLLGVKGVNNRIMVRPVIPPEELHAKIENALKRNAEVDARRIFVDVHDRLVILRGTVRSFAEREAAERAAWSARGVEGVENHLEVDPDEFAE
jgi:osmotically-inducible protein OsmY